MREPGKSRNALARSRLFVLALPFLFALALPLLAALFPGLGACAGLDRLRLPEGFRISVYAEAENARSLALGDRGAVFVGSRRAGKVHALVDADGDSRAERTILLLDGLRMPTGLAFCNGDLYVAEVHRLLRLKDIEDHLDDPPRPEVLNDELPREGRHGWRYMAFSPEGRLYMAIGAPCNVCDEPDPYASIVRFDERWRPEVYARGVRNSVGLTFHPRSGELWFTNNGRDMLGDDLPPDSVHHAPRPGMDFGFPLCHAGEPDPEFNPEGDCSAFDPPALKLPAHTAPLGLRFYDGTMFPERWRGRLFFAEHGSWNRSTPIGYRVGTARLENGRLTDYEIFASGWLLGDEAWGRPADVLVLPDGSLLVSDDKADAVYRVAHD